MGFAALSNISILHRKMRYQHIFKFYASRAAHHTDSFNSFTSVVYYMSGDLIIITHATIKTPIQNSHYSHLSILLMSLLKKSNDQPSQEDWSCFTARASVRQYLISGLSTGQALRGGKPKKWVGCIFFYCLRNAFLITPVWRVQSDPQWTRTYTNSYIYVIIFVDLFLQS